MTERFEGVVGIIRTRNGYLLLPNGKENTGKREKHMAHKKYFPVCGLENMGGKVEIGQNKIQALKEEVLQEGNIPLFNHQIRPANFGVIVEQEGRGLFDVSIYFLELCWLQEMMLRLFKNAREVRVSEIDSTQIRVRDLVILQLTEGEL